MYLAVIACKLVLRFSCFLCMSKSRLILSYPVFQILRVYRIATFYKTDAMLCLKIVKLSMSPLCKWGNFHKRDCYSLLWTWNSDWFIIMVIIIFIYFSTFSGMCMMQQVSGSSTIRDLWCKLCFIKLN